jgi:SNF family Na+-dependent transporter
MPPKEPEFEDLRLQGTPEAFRRFEEDVIRRYQQENPTPSAWHGFMRVTMTLLAICFYAFIAYWGVVFAFRLIQRFVETP